MLDIENGNIISILSSLRQIKCLWPVGCVNFLCSTPTANEGILFGLFSTGKYSNWLTFRIAYEVTAGSSAVRLFDIVYNSIDHSYVYNCGRL